MSVFNTNRSEFDQNNSCNIHHLLFAGSIIFAISRKKCQNFKQMTQTKVKNKRQRIKVDLVVFLNSVETRNKTYFEEVLGTIF